MYLRLILATSSHTVDEQRAVSGDSTPADVGGVVRAERVRVNELLIVSREPLAHIEDGQIILGPFFAQEITSIGLRGRSDRADAHQGREVLVNDCTRRE